MKTGKYYEMFSLFLSFAYHLSQLTIALDQSSR